VKRLAAAGLDGMEDRTFEAFQVTDENKPAYDAARTIGFDRPWLALVGACGTGKSHLCAAIGLQALEARSSVLYVKLPAILRRIKASFRKDSPESEQAVVQHYQRVKVLIVDEFGLKLEMTDWERATLDEIFDYRWERKMILVLASNMPANQLFASAGDRIESRFAQIGTIVPCTWADWRKK
jgi:DNA replication protein DnaC